MALVKNFAPDNAYKTNQNVSCDLCFSINNARHSTSWSWSLCTQTLECGPSWWARQRPAPSRSFHGVGRDDGQVAFVAVLQVLLDGSAFVRPAVARENDGVAEQTQGYGALEVLGRKPFQVLIQALRLLVQCKARRQGVRRHPHGVEGLRAGGSVSRSVIRVSCCSCPGHTSQRPSAVSLTRRYKAVSAAGSTSLNIPSSRRPAT